jgi:hypothetical protein
VTKDFFEVRAVEGSHRATLPAAPRGTGRLLVRVTTAE